MAFSFSLNYFGIRGIPNFVSSHISLPVLANIYRILGNENAHIALTQDSSCYHKGSVVNTVVNKSAMETSIIGIFRGTRKVRRAN